MMLTPLLLLTLAACGGAGALPPSGTDAGAAVGEPGPGIDPPGELEPVPEPTSSPLVGGAPCGKVMSVTEMCDGTPRGRWCCNPEFCDTPGQPIELCGGACPPGEVCASTGGQVVSDPDDPRSQTLNGTCGCVPEAPPCGQTTEPGPCFQPGYGCHPIDGCRLPCYSGSPWCLP